MLARPAAARRQPVALVQRLGDHDLLAAIHQVHGSRILVRDPDAQLQRRQSVLERELVVGAHDLDHLPRQSARPPHAKTRFAFPLEQRQDDGIAFDKDLCGAVYGQQLIHRLIEVQAEIRSRIQPALE